MSDNITYYAGIGDYLSKVTEAGSKDACVLLTSEVTGGIEVAGGDETIECVLSGGKEDNAEHLHAFLAEHFMALCSKSRAIVAGAFEVADGAAALSLYLLPEFMKLSFAKWGLLFPCALACSILGESGRAAVLLPASCLTAGKLEQARKALFGSGLVERVVYLDSRKKQSLVALVFSAEHDRDAGIDLYAASGMRDGSLSVTAIASVGAGEVLEGKACPTRAWAYHVKYSQNWGMDLGGSFGLEVVKRCNPSLFKKPNGREKKPKTSSCLVRVLSPRDFTTEGILVPMSELGGAEEAKAAGKVAVAYYKDELEQLLRPGDVLVARVGSGNAACIVPDVRDFPDVYPAGEVTAFVAGANLIALRPRDPQDALLVRALISGRFAKEQRAGAASGPLPHVTAQDLVRLYVPDMSREDDLLEEIEDATARYRELEKEVVRAREAF